MPVLFHDLESRSTCNIKRCGAHKYAADPSTSILCLAYAVDDQPIQLWLPGDPVPEVFIQAASDPDWIVSAFNANFERVMHQHILAPRHGFPIIPIDRYRCSQAAAQALALPASLKDVAKALDLPHQKDESGKNVMLQMAKPRKPRKGEDPAGAPYWYDDPERHERLRAYCKNDVEVERDIHTRIGHLSDAEQDVWLMDAKINDRGVMVDHRMVAGATKISTAQKELDAEMRVITGGAVEKTSQVERLIQWLGNNNGGKHPLDVGKETVARMLLQTDWPADVRRVLELRRDGAHIASTKFKAMLNWAGSDGRIKGAFKFHAAATGRWASYGTQIQNIKKPPKDLDLAAAIEMISAGNLAEMKKHYDNPLRVVGEAARAAICAAPGHRFIGADFSGIESRVLAWLAGEQSKLDIWSEYDRAESDDEKKALDPYYRLGKQFGFPDDTARTIGKTADLAFGYMGSIGAWRKFAGDEMPDKEVYELRRAWRDAHPNVEKLWGDLDCAALRAVAKINVVQRVNQHLAFCFDGTFLRLRLPSGRKIAYPFARVAPNERGDLVVVFKDNAAGQFVDCRGGRGAWPGLWVENAVQAVARDLLVSAMIRLEAADYSIVMTVHDEIVAEVPEGTGSKEDFIRIMTKLPPWAAGLPISAKGRNGPRYAEVESIPMQDDLPHVDDAGPTAPEEPAEEPKSNGHASASDSDRDHNGYDFSGYASGEREWGEDVDEYVYHDMRGQPYLKVKRTSTKQFPQFHYEGGKWVAHPPKGPKIPYRLPELLAASPETPAFICEGEKDAVNVAALGFVATTNSEGAGKWTDDLNRWFTGRKIAYVLEDNDDAGRAHVRKVARALKGIVPEIRIVSFPELSDKEDVSDWLDQGHTGPELLERCKAALVGGRALNICNIGDLATQPKPKPRGWLLGVSFCREFLSQVQADGGVGKTALRYAQYLSLSSGRALTGEHVHQRCRVLILCFEDSEDELKRRLWAAMIHHGVDPAEIPGWLYFKAVGRDAGKIKTLDEKGRVVDGELATALEQTVLDYRIDLVALDPFVKTHDVGENNNDAIDAVAQVLTNLAGKHNIAVDSAHHVSKGVPEPGNAQKGRGASSLVDAARLVYTLTPMSDTEAKAYGIKDEDRRDYIRLDKGKVNITRSTRWTKWFKLIGVHIGNGNELYPRGDEVQTVETWQPPEAFADVGADLQNAILNDIEAGMDNGQRYSNAAKADKRAAWKVVLKHCPDKTPAQAKEMIKAWVKSGILSDQPYDDPVERKERTGLRLDATKRPS
jgi:DNA polymerase